MGGGGGGSKSAVTPAATDCRCKMADSGDLWLKGLVVRFVNRFSASTMAFLSISTRNFFCRASSAMWTCFLLYFRFLVTNLEILNLERYFACCFADQPTPKTRKSGGFEKNPKKKKTGDWDLKPGD